jgi:signal transduction histidine kinase
MPKGTTIDLPRAPAAGGVPAELLALAPLDLPNLRAERYYGERAGVPLGTFAAPDEAIILRVYAQINALLTILEAHAPAEAISGTLRQLLQTADFDRLRADLRALGKATFAGDPPDDLTAKAIHDIRGGALAVILLRLDFAAGQAFARDGLRTLFMLARDHGKIMRSAVSDLDPVRRQKDLKPQSHHLRLLIEKWHDAAIRRDSDQREIRLFVDTQFDGAVTECCLESAAIDRVIYNLMANARRHHAGDRLDLLIFEVPSAPGENLRFVLRNAVHEADEIRLRALAAQDGAAGDLGALFEAGVSTTGSGLGLAIVADLVSEAFGIASTREALRLGYFGARLLEGQFTVWFHWPAARDGLGTAPASDAAEEVPRVLQKPDGPPPAWTPAMSLAPGSRAPDRPVALR